MGPINASSAVDIFNSVRAGASGAASRLERGHVSEARILASAAREGLAHRELRAALPSLSLDLAKASMDDVIDLTRNLSDTPGRPAQAVGNATSAVRLLDRMASRLPR